jgi:hypothetical protein
MRAMSPRRREPADPEVLRISYAVYDNKVEQIRAYLDLHPERVNNSDGDMSLLGRAATSGRL